MPTILITGANRGLGLELTRQYAADGWRVIAACRDPDAAQVLRGQANDGQVDIRRLDVSDFDAIDALARDLAGTAIDVLLNNAGVFGPKAKAEDDPRQTFGHLDYGIWSNVLRVNLMAPTRMAEAFVDHVAASDQRKIVAISSSEGSIEKSYGSIYAYRTSKAALNMVMRTLAKDLASRGIVTLAICPGWVRTRMGGLAAPLEVGDSIAGVRRLIADLDASRSGSFMDYSGKVVPY